MQQWQQCDRGLIIAGPAQSHEPERYCIAVAQLAQTLDWPVLAEGLSPLRNWSDCNPYLISTYDLLLRNPQLTTQLQPQQVICLGELPTSKELRTWLSHGQPQTWIIHPTDHNLDPLHGHTLHLRLTLEDLVSQLNDESLILQGKRARITDKGAKISTFSSYIASWLTTDQNARSLINTAMQDQPQLLESKVAWLLSHALPIGTPLFIANSMPVRDVEYFWQPGTLRIQPYFNRGANGIDGTLSTALGISHQQQSSVLLTGDLALLHDTNGFLLRRHWQGHLTIIILNNNGGGIFQMLPIAGFDPPLSTYFLMPQDINFEQLAATYGISWEKVSSWTQLSESLNPLPDQGIRILEINCNCQNDTQWRTIFFRQFADVY